MSLSPNFKFMFSTFDFIFSFLEMTCHSTPVSSDDPGTVIPAKTRDGQ